MLYRLGLVLGEKRLFVLFIHNSEYYLLSSNMYQSREKQKEGSVNHIPPLGRLKFFRIPCRSPLWSFGVGSKRAEADVSDKTNRTTEGTSGSFVSWAPREDQRL